MMDEPDVESLAERGVVENDPERCTYEDLDTGLERLIRERYQDAFDTAVARLGVPPEDIGLQSVSWSIESNRDGGRWLKLLSTDGSTWYSGWKGDSNSAMAFAEEFAQDRAEDIIS